MATTFNALGSQNINGSIQQDRFYAFTYDQNLDHVRADAIVSTFSWATSIKTSATTFLTVAGNNVQISADFYAGGEKVDFIYGSNLNDAILYNNGVISGGVGSFSSIEQVELGAGDDIIDLTAHGAGGVDYGKNIIINGGDGNDIIIGGAGLDTLYGDGGDDLIFGYRGSDSLYGGGGNDTLYGDDLGFNGIAGADFLYGEAGNDLLDGGARGDQLNGGEGDDTLIGGGGDDFVFGDIGVDTAIFSGNRNDYAIVWDGFTSLHRITDLRPGSPDGTDHVSGVEFFRFADGTVPASVPNNPPIITSNGGGLSAQLTVEENSTSVTTVAATDSESGQVVTYSISGGLDAALFSIDNATGVVTFINPPDYENPADTSGDNIYYVVVRATDNLGAFDEQTLTIEVTDILDASPPIITSNGGGDAVTININENSTTVTTVTASDADTALLDYSIVGGADAGFFSINPETGELVFTSAPDYERPNDANGDNLYNVIVQASDGTYSDQQQIFVRVGNVNDNAPVITSGGGGSSAQASVAELSSAVTWVRAHDFDQNPLTYSIVGGADAALFSIDPATGALVFNSAPDFEMPADVGLNNVYDVIVRASDGINFDDQALAVTVTDVNEVGATITASTGNNTISPTAVQYRTTAGNDTIYALAGNDIIDGGAGADRMEGGTGDDTYYVDQFSDDSNASNDDLVIELAAAGTDTIIAGVSYNLTANVENLTLAGVAAINGTGNELNNIIIGNSAANILSGGLGNDTLTGGDGNDTLVGGAGADRLDGGTGADIMQGGADNDIYFVDAFHYFSPFDSDQVIESAGEGIDTVNSSVEYLLPNEVENLTLTGTGPIAGTGNGLANILTGNDYSNNLYGYDGDDTINGAGGNDNLQAGNGNDTLNGGTGNDNLNGDAGADKLSGGDGDDGLWGGYGNDTLNGQAGNDRLWGGAQKDSLTGGAGSDIFEFRLNDSSISSSTYDVITDFVTGIDKIDLFRTISASAYTEAAIATNLFSDAMASAQSMFTAGKSVAFVAGTTDGWLFWDQNGDGVIDQSILLKGLNSVGAMDYTDFI